MPLASSQFLVVILRVVDSSKAMKFFHVGASLTAETHQRPRNPFALRSKHHREENTELGVARVTSMRCLPSAAIFRG